MSVRVYLPSSPALLQALLVSGGIGPAPLLGHAVTDGLRTEYGQADEEEWEYAALSAAAQDSVGLLSAEERPRRVVVVAEVPTATPVPGDEPSLVEIRDAVALRVVEAVHVDDADAEACVADAREAWVQAQEGDVAALDRLEVCLDHELAWFATQEIGDVVAQLEA